MPDQHQAGGSGAGSTVDLLEDLRHMDQHEMVRQEQEITQLRADLEAAQVENGRLQTNFDAQVAATEGCYQEIYDAKRDLAQAEARISELEQSHAECARTADLERAVVEAARAYRNASQSLQAHQTVCLDSPCEDCDDILGPAVERTEDVLFTALDAAPATKAADA